MSRIEVANNEEQERYELLVDGERAGLLAYRREDGRVVMFHTEVDPAREGEGLGTRLVADALADARARGLAVTPTCTFVAAYLRRHPGAADVA